MTNGTLTSYVRAWEEGDRGGKVVAKVATVLINATGAVALTVVPADFGWTYFFDSWVLHDSAGATFQWTITKDASGNISSMVTATNPAAGAALGTFRGF